MQTLCPAFPALPGAHGGYSSPTACGLVFFGPSNVFTLENYFLTFKVIFSFTVGSRSVGISVPPSKVPCLLKLEKLYSETRNSSTIFENAQYGTEEKQKGKNKTK